VSGTGPVRVSRPRASPSSSPPPVPCFPPLLPTRRGDRPGSPIRPPAALDLDRHHPGGVDRADPAAVLHAGGARRRPALRTTRLGLDLVVSQLPPPICRSRPSRGVARGVGAAPHPMSHASPMIAPRNRAPPVRSQRATSEPRARNGLRLRRFARQHRADPAIARPRILPASRTPDREVAGRGKIIRRFGSPRRRAEAAA
jgi:hypothetical protein